MKRTSFFLFVGMVMGLLVLGMFAQVPTPAVPVVHQPLDLGGVDIVLGAGLFGLGVKGLTQMIKGWLKWDGPKVVGISIVVSAVSSFIYTVKAYAGDAAAVIIYGIILTCLVALAANGLYKSGQPQKPIV